MKNLMRQLSAQNDFCAVSGSERALLTYIREQLQDCCDDAYTDAMGNLFLTVGKGVGSKVLFSAYADTVGLITHCADEKGLLCVSAVGEASIPYLPGVHVRFSSGTEGVIISKKDDFSELSALDLRVDIGASDKETAEALVPPGSFCQVLGDYFVSDSGNVIFGPHLDNHLGVAVLMQVISDVCAKKEQLKNELCFVFSVQGQLAARGTAPAAYTSEPKYAVTVGAAWCDSPETSVICGGGACIKVLDKNVCCHSQAVDFLRSVAQTNKILYQCEVSSLAGTEAGVVQRARQGVYTGCVGIPVRYRHTPCEAVKVSDFESAKRLITESIFTGFSF